MNDDEERAAAELERARARWTDQSPSPALTRAMVAIVCVEVVLGGLIMWGLLALDRCALR